MALRPDQPIVTGDRSQPLIDACSSRRRSVRYYYRFASDRAGARNDDDQHDIRFIARAECTSAASCYGNYFAAIPSRIWRDPLSHYPRHTRWYSSLRLTPQGLITDDARIVDPKPCQLETWMRRNQGSTEYWALPACNPTGNVELTIGGARTHEFGETHTSDLQVQAKTLFKALETNSWGSGVAFGSLRHPQSEPDRSFGANLYAYVPTNFSFADDRFVVHTNVGTLRAEGKSHHRFAWGLGAEMRVNASLFVIPEMFSQSARGTHFQVGARYWVVPGRMQVDATLGDRIGRSNGEHWFSIGVRLLTPAFLR